VLIGRAAGLTDRGRRRRQNEDAFVCDPPLFAIADGMGGAQAGELASRIAAAVIEQGAATARDEDGVVAAVRAANALIFERALNDPGAAGMGTTATVALVDERDETLTIAHVGDSRAYRYRNGALEQLTTDHSLVAELVRSGRLTEAEAAVHPHRSVITRALGTDAEVDVDTLTVPLAAGDLVLLCSDGLSAMVRDEEIVAVLVSSAGDPHHAAEALVRAANAAGGDDNVTVVVFELVEGDAAARAAQTTASDREVTEEDVRLVSEQAGEDDDDVRRHGAGRGSRWPALLLVVVLLALAAFVLWWSLLR
jgi:PPM family protein phosphatase